MCIGKSIVAVALHKVLGIPARFKYQKFKFHHPYWEYFCSQDKKLKSFLNKLPPYRDHIIFQVFLRKKWQDRDITFDKYFEEGLDDLGIYFIDKPLEEKTFYSLDKWVSLREKRVHIKEDRLEFINRLNAIVSGIRLRGYLREFGGVDERKFKRIILKYVGEETEEVEKFKENLEKIYTIINKYREKNRYLIGLCQKVTFKIYKTLNKKINISRPIPIYLNREPFLHQIIIWRIPFKDKTYKFIMDPTASQFIKNYIGLLVIPLKVAEKDEETLWMYKMRTDCISYKNNVQASSPVIDEDIPSLLSRCFERVEKREIEQDKSICSCINLMFPGKEVKRWPGRN